MSTSNAYASTISADGHVVRQPSRIRRRTGKKRRPSVHQDSFFSVLDREKKDPENAGVSSTNHLPPEKETRIEISYVASRLAERLSCSEFMLMVLHAMLMYLCVSSLQSVHETSVLSNTFRETYFHGIQYPDPPGLPSDSTGIRTDDDLNAYLGEMIEKITDPKNNLVQQSPVFAVGFRLYRLVNGKPGCANNSQACSLEIVSSVAAFENIKCSSLRWGRNNTFCPNLNVSKTLKESNFDFSCHECGVDYPRGVAKASVFLTPSDIPFNATRAKDVLLRMLADQMIDSKTVRVEVLVGHNVTWSHYLAQIYLTFEKLTDGTLRPHSLPGLSYGSQTTIIRRRLSGQPIDDQRAFFLICYGILTGLFFLWELREMYLLGFWRYWSRMSNWFDIFTLVFQVLFIVGVTVVAADVVQRIVDLEAKTPNISVEEYYRLNIKASSETIFLFAGWLPLCAFAMLATFARLFRATSFHSFLGVLYKTLERLLLSQRDLLVSIVLVLAGFACLSHISLGYIGVEGFGTFSSSLQSTGLIAVGVFDPNAITNHVSSVIVNIMSTFGLWLLILLVFIFSTNVLLATVIEQLEHTADIDAAERQRQLNQGYLSESCMPLHQLFWVNVRHPKRLQQRNLIVESARHAFVNLYAKVEEANDVLTKEELCTLLQDVDSHLLPLIDTNVSLSQQGIERALQEIDNDKANLLADFLMSEFGETELQREERLALQSEFGGTFIDRKNQSFFSKLRQLFKRTGAIQDDDEDAVVQLMQETDEEDDE